jgi:pimeloyl-ACP methyl ester carboxylesterase
MDDMRRVTVRGLDLATVDVGQGAPLVLVHGFPLDHTMWNAQIRALSDGYRVIAPDLRGFGQSSVATDKVTMEDFADDVAAVLAAVEIRQPVVFCGLSMGGYVAWQFWSRHRALLRALILCDTRAAADPPEVAAARRDTAEHVLAGGLDSLADTMIPKLFAEETIVADDHLVQSYRRTILSTDPKGVAAAQRGMAERADFTGLLDRIDCPTLVIVGEHDVISPVEEMRGIAEAIPQAELAVIPKAGHMSPVENSDDVNRVMGEFLDRTFKGLESATDF